MSVLAVGSVALDSVETPYGARDDILGGSATYFSMAASYFAPVQLVGVVGEDFPERHIDLFESRRIDLSGLVRTPGATFRWRGRYCDQMNEAQTLDTRLNVFARFDPVLPEAFRTAPIVFLGNIDPELQGRVLDQMEKPRLVAADTMNFWINGKPEALRATLRRVDLLFVNDAEARAIAGEASTIRAAHKIVGELGPRILVIKRGEYGAMLFDGQKFFSVPAYPTTEVRDPTGAGDSFAGGFLGHVARCGELGQRAFRQALVMGSVMASCTVEGFSLERLAAVTREDIEGRFALFRDMLELDGLPDEA